MAQEKHIALGVMQIAASQASGICSFRRAYNEIPNYVKLSTTNSAPSQTRPGEVMWQQIVRNIKSHDKASGNFISDGYLVHVPKTGYAITPSGRRYLKAKGLHP
ncbi:MAG TPA: hypothetical protein VJS47_06240 [Rhizomicrobium sp.]|nr:hypothetical protein [Rhizomicrobium sp.]